MISVSSVCHLQTALYHENWNLLKSRILKVLFFPGPLESVSVQFMLILETGEKKCDLSVMTFGMYLIWGKSATEINRLRIICRRCISEVKRKHFKF